MFNMVGRPVGVTKGKVAESRAAVLTASSAQYLVGEVSFADQRVPDRPWKWPTAAQSLRWSN